MTGLWYYGEGEEIRGPLVDRGTRACAGPFQCNDSEGRSVEKL